MGILEPAEALVIKSAFKAPWALAHPVAAGLSCTIDPLGELEFVYFLKHHSIAFRFLLGPFSASEPSPHTLSK